MIDKMHVRVGTPIPFPLIILSLFIGSVKIPIIVSCYLCRHAPIRHQTQITCSSLKRLVRSRGDAVAVADGDGDDDPATALCFSHSSTLVRKYGEVKCLKMLRNNTMQMKSVNDKQMISISNQNAV